MKRREREIWPDGSGESGETADKKSVPEPTRRRDTDLSEPSVRKSRRQLRREEQAAERAAERAPWDDPAQDGNTTAEDGRFADRTARPQPSSAAYRSQAEPAESAADAADPAGRTAAADKSATAHEPDPASGEENAKPRKNTLASVLSGNILSQSEVRRAYPYMIFVACLMFLYIANVFRAQYIYRQHATLTEQVKELRAKSMTIASERMQATQQSNIMVELERRGIPLRESLTPNKVIPNPKRNGEETDDR